MPQDCPGVCWLSNQPLGICRETGVIPHHTHSHCGCRDSQGAHNRA